jgi:superfamily II DNA or RNA helicase
MHLTQESLPQARLEDLVRGVRVRGVSGADEVTVDSVTWHGTNAVTVTFRDDAGHLGDAIVYRDMEPSLRVASKGPVADFDAPGADFKLAAEALRIRMAGRFDPMLAVTTSLVDPLPHQLQAVYGELLERQPLRFLLADDPGAGKTIMAGLFIKELLLRGDLARCLVVAPGSLVEQWQDELSEKFGLRFDILTRAMIDASVDGQVFAEHPLLIARMDQLSRSEELQAQLEATDWDLIVVDEAHRMSAHYFGQELKTTKRYQLGQLLGRITRHLLLMTATPHAGKDEDFQLFMALLDGDRFEGKFRDGVHAMDVDGLMRRMVKEELLTFDGKPLFPERVAQTVPYELSPGEQDLYEAVTQYVREEMNRAEKLKAEGEGRRSNTVGFALTVLQRRLASSPEAIWKSLERRRIRLEKRRQELTNPTAAVSPLGNRLDLLLGRDIDEDDLDDLDAEEREALEENVLDAATAARTAAELDVEIGILKDLEELARQVRFAGTDRKWNELRSILLDDRLVHDGSGNLRKIIIFTEHRDTLNYLTTQIRQLLGRPEAVVEIHGGVRREERRKVQELFTKDKDVQVLVATDAAGEGLNLQRAHLMVNYDLPWNPNRLEQRFGRIHRIGQKEVCHLWNLVAITTREGAVYARLLDKIEEQRRAYDGKVFDVLGEAFSETPLRDLLMQAIRYGEQPDVRAYLDQVIDASPAKGLEKLMAERALAADTMSTADVAEIRLAMETARARRLQPHYIRSFFLEAFTQLGGRITARETGRYEITHVPATIRDRDRIIGGRTPMLARYERVTFDREHIDADHGPKADLISPGHPLLDATIDLVIERHGTALKHGAVLVDHSDPGVQPRLLVGIAQEITDGHTPSRTVSKRFDYVEITPDGDTVPSGPAPYLDYDPTGDQPTAREVLAKPWLADNPETLATTWAITEGSMAHRTEVSSRISAQVAKTREQVHQRLTDEINYWDARSLDLLDQESMGRKLKVSAATASNRARTLETRLAARLQDLDLDEALTVKPPVIAAMALILPTGLLRGGDTPPMHAKDTEEVDRRAIAATMAAERQLGRVPTEMPHNNKGFDIMSDPGDGQIITIEVKGRIEGATDVTFTKNEVLMGKNTGANFRVALVKVSADGQDKDEIRYLTDPFANEPDPAFDTTRITKDWASMWGAGGEPQ